MVRENPPLSTAFVAQFTQALQGRGATTTFVLAWLEQRLAEQGQTIEEVVRAESQSQAADQASMANSIASLRLRQRHRVAQVRRGAQRHRADPARRAGGRVWPDGFRDPRRVPARGGGHWPGGCASTRRRWPGRRWRWPPTRHAAQSDDVAAHVGYLLVDDGQAASRASAARAAGGAAVPPAAAAGAEAPRLSRTGRAAVGRRRRVAGHASAAGHPISRGRSWRSARPWRHRSAPSRW